MALRKLAAKHDRWRDAIAALAAARLDDDALHVWLEDPTFGAIARAERGERRGRGPHRGRGRLAERLMEPAARTDEAVRALLDEASLGEIPAGMDLVCRWLRAELGERVSGALGPAERWLAPPGPADPALSEAASAWLATGPEPRLPSALAEAEAEPRRAAIEAAIVEAPPGKAQVEPLARAIAGGDAAIAVPLLCGLLGRPRDAASTHRRQVFRELSASMTGSLVASAVCAGILVDDLRPGQRAWEVQRDARVVGGLPVVAALWLTVWTSRDGDGPWSALVSLGEPGALCEALASQLEVPALLGEPEVGRPSEVRALVRIVQRLDPRLAEVSTRDLDTGDLVPAGDAVWGLAVDRLPERALAWNAAATARPALVSALAACAARPADARRVALAAGRLGAIEALPVLLDALNADDTLDPVVARALAALGPAAADASPRLQAFDTPWAWVVLARIDPVQPGWRRALAAHLADNAVRLAHLHDQFAEGLITHRELADGAALWTEGAVALRGGGGDPDVAHHADRIAAAVPDGFAIAGLDAAFREIAARS